MENLNISAATLLSAFDAIPAHPYEKLKFEHFDKDHKFPTLDDITVPEDFCTHTCLCTLTSIDDQHAVDHQGHYDNLDLHETHEHLGNAFATFDGEKFDVNKDKLKKYIEFHELALSIDPNTINESNCNEIAQKLLTHYTGIFK